MIKLKCVLTFVFLLFYVKFNAAADCDHCYAGEPFEMLEAKVRELESTVTTLKAQLNEQQLATNALLIEKDKCMAELKMQNLIHPAEASSCLAFGNASDIQTIRVPGSDAFQVCCDSKIAGAGWTVIQRRVDGTVNFNRSWQDYREGFGDLHGDLWLGLEKLHLLTKFQPHELYIELRDFQNETRYVRYSNFSIGSELQAYELLTLGAYSGNAGNALDSGNDRSAKHMKFSTPERDNDNWGANCAARVASGWWFNECFDCNPNGVYVHNETDKIHILSIVWTKWHYKPLKFVQMMIRPRNK